MPVGYNRYRFSFSVMCPVNGENIAYEWEIVTEAHHVIQAEAIASAANIATSQHEQIADLLAGLGGQQWIRATHGGVQIETYRDIETSG